MEEHVLLVVIDSDAAVKPTLWSPFFTRSVASAQVHPRPMIWVPKGVKFAAWRKAAFAISTAVSVEEKVVISLPIASSKLAVEYGTLASKIVLDAPGIDNSQEIAWGK